MAHRKKTFNIFTVLADISKRVPLVRLERVDTFCSTLQKSGELSWKIKEDRGDKKDNKEKSFSTLRLKDRKKGKERKKSTTKKKLETSLSSSSNLELENNKREENTNTLQDISIKVEKFEKKPESETNEGFCIRQESSLTIKQEVKLEEYSDSIFTEMFPENYNEDTLTTLEPPKKQHKLQDGSDHSKQVSNEELTTFSTSNISSQEINKEIAMCDNNSPSIGKFPIKNNSDTAAVSQAHSYSGSNSCAIFMQNNQKETASAGWENNRPVLNSLQFSGNSVSGVQTPTYSGNRGSRQHSVMAIGNVRPQVEQNRLNIRPQMDHNRFSYSGHGGPGISAQAYAGDNNLKLNPPTYSSINRPMTNPLSYPRNSSLNPPSFPGNNNSDVDLVTYPSSSPSMNSPSYSGSTVHPLSYSGYSNMSTCTGTNAPGINSQTYATNRPGINSSYTSNSTPVINSSDYPGNGRSAVYYGNNMPGVTLQTYSENTGTGVNTSVYSGSSGQTYSGNNNMAFTVSSGAQNYSGNNGMGMNVLGFPNNNTGTKLNAGNYCGNKGSELNTLPYSGSSTAGYSGSSSTRGSEGFSSNSTVYTAVTSTITYSGNNTTTSSQTCSSFPANLIAQQYEVLQNYCDNDGTGISNTGSQDSTWSNDYITLNNLSTNNYQLGGCSLDFSYMLTCQMCGTVMATVTDMIKHWRIHNGVDSLTCTACYVSFTDVLFLQAHWKAIHMGGMCIDPGVILRPDEKVLSELVCEACGFGFSQLNSLEQHMMSAHVNIQQWKYIESQQNHKPLQNIPITNDNSITKHVALLDNNSLGTRHDQSIMEHQNILDESMIENKMDNIVESDVDLIEPKVKIEIFENSEDKGSNSSDDSISSSEQDKPFKCRICDIASSSLEELLEHWKIHIGADTMTCSMCRKTFTDLPFLQAHWRRSHMNAFQISSLVTRNSLLPDDSLSLLCDACGYAFPDFSELEQHMISSHVSSGPPQVPLRTRNSADNIQKVSLTPLQNISTSNIKNDIINLYKKKETSSDTKRGVCDRTEAKKKEEQSVNKREEVRRKVNSSNIVKKTVSSDGCIVCGEIPSDMIKHLVTHTGLSSLECCLCGKDFVDVPFLQAHWRATHMNGEVRHTNHGIYVGNYKENVSYTGKFLCETCGCYVPQFSALEKHIVLTHTIIEPPYICKCGHRFSLEEELKRHISTCSW